MRLHSVSIACMSAELAFAGCHPVVGRPAPSESLRGTVSIAGTAFEQQFMLVSGAGSTRLTATGEDSVALSHLGGVEVLASGTRGPNSFRVADVMAMTVAGMPVADGILRDDGGKLYLDRADHRVLLGNPPPALRSLMGARVWIGGPLDSGPNTYGVITPAK